MSKDKKKKHKKKALKKILSSTPSLGSAANWQVGCASQVLEQVANPSVTLEFIYFGTRYKGTAYPVGEAGEI